MSKKEKLLLRFASKPKDFSWDELERLLGYFGYELMVQGKTGGSRRRFVHSTHPTISLHKPHLGNILKRYQLEQILEVLRQEKLL